MSNIYAVPWLIQEKEIKAFCFDQCKKVIFGLVMDDQLGGLSTCTVTECPFERQTMDEPFGEVHGDYVYLRALRTLEEKDGEE